MKKLSRLVFLGTLALLGVLTVSCGRKSGSSHAHAHKHEHRAPHGGTVVVLGNEAYHLELVREEATGKLQLYVLDGELEKFVRCAAASLVITAPAGGAEQTLVFKPVANSATGETVGDTALFEAQADWLKTTKEFDAVLKEITVRGTTFRDVKFNFPKGNETDA